MRLGRTFAEVLLQLHDAAVLPQLGAVLVELHRRQHVDVQLLAQRLCLLPLRLRRDRRLCKCCRVSNVAPYRWTS